MSPPVPRRALAALVLLALAAALPGCALFDHGRRRQQTAVKVFEAPLPDIWPHVREFAKAENLKLLEDKDSFVITTEWVERFGGSKHAAMWERWAFIGRRGGPTLSRVWVLRTTRGVNTALRHPGEDLIWGQAGGSGASSGGRVATETYATNDTGEGGSSALNAAEDPNAIGVAGDLGMHGNVQEGGRDFTLEEKLQAYLEPRIQAAREAARRGEVSEAVAQEEAGRRERERKAAEQCGDTVPGLGELFAPNAVVLLGENPHGTEQAPAFVARAACFSAAMGVPVTVGLELPADMQEAVSAYLKSDGAEAARAALLEHTFWHRPFPDGRSSKGVLALLEEVRAMRQKGLDVQVLVYDYAKEQGNARAEKMARRVQLQVESDPQRFNLLLGGNVHSRIAEGGPWGKDFRSMGWRLAQAMPDVVALDMAFGPGTAWICTVPEGGKEGSAVPRCGPAATKGPRTQGDRPFVYRFGDGPRQGFHGFFYVGPVNASPPAVATPGSGGDAPTAQR